MILTNDIAARILARRAEPYAEMSRDTMLAPVMDPLVGQQRVH